MREADRLGQVRPVQAEGAVFPQFPGQVVVPVDQRHLAEQLPGHRELARAVRGHQRLSPAGMDSTAAPCTRSASRSVSACWACSNG